MCLRWRRDTITKPTQNTQGGYWVGHVSLIVFLFPKNKNKILMKNSMIFDYGNTCYWITLLSSLKHFDRMHIQRHIDMNLLICATKTKYENFEWYGHIDYIHFTSVIVVNFFKKWLNSLFYEYLVDKHRPFHSKFTVEN